MDYISVNTEALFADCDSQTIQNAITEAERTGCRKIVIPRYNLRTGKTQWRITKCIRIPSDFTVVLDNCHMVMETGVYDHMFANSQYLEDVERTVENEQKNISILGVGNVCLDGGVHNHLMEKTSGRYGLPRVWKNVMLMWVNVSGLRLENLHIENQRWWAITHIFCRNAVLRNIDFDAVPHVPNMDGIDLRMGCCNFTMENITGRTGDDVIALNAVGGDYELKHAVKGRDHDIHDVKIRNVLGDPFLHLVVRLLTHDGNKLYNIDLDTVYDISDYTTKKRPACTLGIGSMIYASKALAAPEDTHHITARHLTSRGGAAIRIDNACMDSTFTNVKTFGDNLSGISTLDRARLHNVMFDSFFYGSTQMEIYCSKALDPSKYVGTVANFATFSGDVTLRNLVVDKVNTVFSAGNDLTVQVDGYRCTCCLKQTDIRDQARVILNGEVIKNG